MVNKLQNSPQELAALRAIIDDPAIRIEESVFRARYWPVLRNLVTNPEGLQIWRAEVDSSLLRYVDIVKGGVVVARVPPIFATYPTETKYHPSRAMAKIADDIGHCLEISPIAAGTLVENVLPEHYRTIESSQVLQSTKQEIRDTWDSLYRYFGEKPPFSKNTVTADKVENKPVNKNGLEVDEWDDEW